AVITSSFVVAAVGAYYMLRAKDVEYAGIFLKLGVTAGLIFSLLQLFPTGDQQGKIVALRQPVTLAAVECLFDTQGGAPDVISCQPDMEKQYLDNPIIVPGVLSFLTYRRWGATVKGLNEFPRDQWPDNIPLLYYSYHIMVGLGTIFIAIAAVAAILLLR